MNHPAGAIGSRAVTADACRQCGGTGVTKNAMLLRAGFRDCHDCGASGLARQPRFRAQCECGAKQPRLATASTAERWMKAHLRTHRSTAPPVPLDDSAAAR